MQVMIIGMGEVGSSIANIVKKKHKIIEIDKDPVEVNKKIDVCHLCYPYFENFADIAINYIKKYNPNLTIIESTVPPGTTEKIFKKTKKPIVHSPVRGMHPDLSKYIKYGTKYIGPADKNSADLAKKYYESVGIKTKILRSPREAELGKLFSTTYYGLCIAWHQEMKRICDHFGADFNQVVIDFNRTYNELYKKYPHPNKNVSVTRPILFPGKIGGHCVMPNAEILKKIYKSDFFDVIIKSNKKEF